MISLVGGGRFNELVAGAVRDRVLQMSYRHVNLHRGTEHPIRDTKPPKIRNRGRHQRHTLSSCYEAKAELDERPSMRRLQSNQTYSRDRRPGAKRTLPVQLSRHWADRLTGRAEVATFQGVGHLVFLESLDAVTRVGFHEWWRRIAL